MYEETIGATQRIEVRMEEGCVEISDKDTNRASYLTPSEMDDLVDWWYTNKDKEE